MKSRSVVVSILLITFTLSQAELGYSDEAKETKSEKSMINKIVTTGLGAGSGLLAGGILIPEVFALGAANSTLRKSEAFGYVGLSAAAVSTVCGLTAGAIAASTQSNAVKDYLMKHPAASILVPQVASAASLLVMLAGDRLPSYFAQALLLGACASGGISGYTAGTLADRAMADESPTKLVQIDRKPAFDEIKGEQSAN